MLINSQATQSEDQTFVFVNGEIVVEQKSKNKIYNIESWTDAFLIFSSIYGAAHPESYPYLLKYMNVMRLGAKRSQGWKNYDEQYRLRKAQDPSSSWATIDQELWLLYLYSAPAGSNVQPSSSSHKCYNYNYQGSCTKLYCSYAHNCIRCNGQHSVIQCPRQAYNPNRLPGGTLSRMPVQQPVRLATRLPSTYPRFQPRQSQSLPRHGFRMGHF